MISAAGGAIVNSLRRFRSRLDPFPKTAKTRGEERGAIKKIDIFLTNHWRVCYCFSEISSEAFSRFLNGVEAGLAIRCETKSEVKSLKTNDLAKWPISHP
jgi:hypothetical protein